MIATAAGVVRANEGFPASLQQPHGVLDFRRADKMQAQEGFSATARNL